MNPFEQQASTGDLHLECSVEDASLRSVAAITGSLTYEPYYGLKEKPFSLSPDPRFLYKSQAHASAFKELTAAIRRREGLIVLSGEIGTGKTTLCRAVLQQLDRRTFSAFVPDPFVSREDLLKTLLVEFGSVSMDDLRNKHLEGHSRFELSYRLHEFLTSLAPLQAFAVLVIDEAQNLSEALLEEIRVLADMEGREKLLQVVLVGQPELKDRLKLPEMRQVDQRVSMRCELTPLGRASLRSYVNHRLAVAGDGAANVWFTHDALEAIHEVSGGTPRVVNLVCDRALHEGFLACARQIGPALVAKAIESLGISAPTPAAVEPAPEVATEPAVIAVREPVDSFDEFRAESTEAPVPSGFASMWSAAQRRIGVMLTAGALCMAGCVGWTVVSTTLAVRAITVPPAPASAASKRLVSGAANDNADASPAYVIQAASFDTQAQSAASVQSLVARGYPARQVEVNTVDRRHPAWTVVLGAYETLNEAAADLERLRTEDGYQDAALRGVFE